jgi:hypothetical protein
MPKKSNKKKSKSSRNKGYSNQSSMGNSMNTQIAVIPRAVRVKTWEFILKSTPFLASTDGAGILSLNTGVNNPASANNFSELSGIFDLYMIKKFTFYFLPFVPNGSSSTADYRPVYCLYDADATATPISSISTAVQYDTMRAFSIYLPIEYRCVPQKVANAAPIIGGWINCGTPTNTGQFQIYGNNLDLSTSYGTVYYEYVAVFRNVR